MSTQEGLDCRFHLPRDDVPAVSRIVGHVLGQVSRICRGKKFSYEPLDRTIWERMSEEGSDEARRAKCMWGEHGSSRLSRFHVLGGQ